MVSDYSVIFIPTDPQYVPEEALQLHALAWARVTFPLAGEISHQTTDEVCFIDQGENFASISCPVCATSLEIAWWHQAMEQAFATHFSDLFIATPCCGTQLSLNDLHYILPAGFARYSLQIREPGIDSALLDDEIMRTLASVIQHDIRVIYQII